jgi:hypothetical protein
MPASSVIAGLQFTIERDCFPIKVKLTEHGWGRFVDYNANGMTEYQSGLLTPKN